MRGASLVSTIQLDVDNNQQTTLKVARSLTNETMCIKLIERLPFEIFLIISMIINRLSFESIYRRFSYVAKSDDGIKTKWSGPVYTCFDLNFRLGIFCFV